MRKRGGPASYDEDGDWRQLGTGSYGGLDDRVKRRGPKRPPGFTTLETRKRAAKSKGGKR